MSLSDFRDKLANLPDAFAADPEMGHGDEDGLLWRVVQLAAEDDPQAGVFARELVAFNDENPDRVKWYA